MRRFISGQRITIVLYGGGVQRGVEGEIFFNLYAQESLCYLQVAAARYGQEFGQTLHGAEYD